MASRAEFGGGGFRPRNQGIRNETATWVNKVARKTLNADVSGFFSAREGLRDTGDHGRSAEINGIDADYPMIVTFPVRQ